MRLLDAFRASLSFATFNADTVPAPTDRPYGPPSSRRPRTVVHEVLPLDAGTVFGRVVLTP